MIAAASRRNAAFVATGTAEFFVMRLVELDLADRRFDVVFAVRVGLFALEPRRARALIARWLKPTGRVHAVFDPPARRGR